MSSPASNRFHSQQLYPVPVQEPGAHVAQEELQQPVAATWGQRTWSDLTNRVSRWKQTVSGYANRCVTSWRQASIDQKAVLGNAASVAGGVSLALSGHPLIGLGSGAAGVTATCTWAAKEHAKQGNSFKATVYAAAAVAGGACVAVACAMGMEEVSSVTPPSVVDGETAQIDRDSSPFTKETAQPDTDSGLPPGDFQSTDPNTDQIRAYHQAPLSNQCSLHQVKRSHMLCLCRKMSAGC